MSTLRILPAGDTAAVCEFGREISPELNSRVHSLDRAVKNISAAGIIETVPTFRSLLVIYDPCVLTFAEISALLEKLAESDCDKSESKSTVYTIPVCYGGEFGPDIADVASNAGISEDEVIKRHSAKPYLIYMLGFLPGFAYLGGLDKSIVTPRLSSPRQKIDAGAVGIGGEQTGIYPIASPGGWRLIGRTPVRPYDPEKADPILYKAGDYIRFKPVDRAEYNRIAAEVEAGTYVCERTVG